ncbi:MAG: tetratricopeptide repeat protein, partial [Oscillatoriales cyanobacterium SM2_2_1]|nr:tetratricopeptide repeat protein [Oscillatoriales cyanobacterium SM2_2_1]
LLEDLNWQRDNFREYFPHLHLCFLLPIYGIKYFIRRAPDFFDWRSSVTKYPAEREALERHLGELLRDTDFESYKRLSPQEIKHRIWEIEAQLGEDCLNSERKAELCQEQGRLLHAGANYRGAIDCRSEAIRLNPDYARAYYNRALAKSDLGDKEGAIADYSEAIRLNPDHAYAYNNRGVAKYELGDKEGAISDLREAARLNQQQGKTSDYEDAQNRIKELGG